MIAMGCSVRMCLIMVIACLWQGNALAQWTSEVQTPSLAAPQRGSVAGSLAQFVPDGHELSRGALALPLPIELPAERGEVLAQIFPSYSQDGGLGPWGLGWAGATSITRMRQRGTIDYVTDGFLTPWGEVTRGDDGYWYPLQTGFTIRLKFSGEHWEAENQHGKHWSFGGTASDTTPSGVYAWHLQQVRDEDGRLTRLAYDTNASGRNFLRSVTYGRAPASNAYQIVLDYDVWNGFDFPSYRSKSRFTLDRRVRTVRVSARDTSSGAFVERWRYNLTYEADGLGPAFYLTGLQRVFSGGQAEPPVSYAYRQLAPFLQRTAHRSLPEMASFMREAAQDDGGTLSAAEITLVDDDDDGVPDIEHHRRFARYTRAGKWDKELLQDAPGVHPACRGTASRHNAPRRFVKMRPDDRESLVFLQDRTLPNQLLFCNRLGQPLPVQPSLPTQVSQAWGQFLFTDLNGDRHPELVVLDPGEVCIYRNLSDSAGYHFGDAQCHHPSPRVDGPQTLQDVNGDGIPDLVAQSGANLYVWYGRGDLTFESEAKVFTVQGPTGVFDCDHQQLTFIDANRDGLADLLVSDGRQQALFINNGDRFVFVDVPGLYQWPRHADGGSVADFAGSGEIEIASMGLRDVFSIALTEAGSSLLQTVDDGCGTQLSFDYARAPTQSGAGMRHAVVSRVHIRRAGEQPRDFDVSYQAATLHSATRALLGFNAVTVRNGRAEHRIDFHHDDHVQAVPRQSVRRAAGGLEGYELVAQGFASEGFAGVGSAAHGAPGGVAAGHIAGASEEFEEFVKYTYAPARYHGIAFARMTAEERGLRDPASGRSMSRQTFYEKYEEGVCLAQSRAVSSRGELVTRRAFVRLPKLSGLPQCLMAKETQTGRHGDTSLDFSHTIEINRNSFGKPTQVKVGNLVTQEVRYDCYNHVEASGTPASGFMRARYDAATGTLTEVEQPDGVRTSVKRDAVSDAIVTLTTHHGDRAYTQSYAYDTSNRLWKQWHDLTDGGSGALSAARPLTVITYQHPDAVLDRPGLIRSDTLLKTAGSRQSAVALQSGSGATVATAELFDGGWRLGQMVEHLPDSGRHNTRLHDKPIPDLGFSGFAKLFAEAELLGQEQLSPLGRPVATEHAVQHNRSARSSFIYQIDASGLTARETRNAGYITSITRDAFGEVVQKVDAAGGTTQAVYDLLGRIRRVNLGDGSTHAADFDEVGRLAQVGHSNAPHTTHEYDKGSGRLSCSHTLGSHGGVQQSVCFTYDAIGRKARDTYKAPQKSDITFDYFYDGASPMGRKHSGQTGFLTGMAGEGLQKHTAYRPDGAVLQTRVRIANWRDVESRYDYSVDGILKATHTAVRDAGGGIAHEEHVGYERDDYGRPQRVVVDGTELYAMHYDEKGYPAGVTMGAVRQTLDLQRDRRTRRLSGVTRQNAGSQAELRWDLDLQGHVGEESLKNGGVEHQRRYAYDATDNLSGWHQNSGEHETYVYGHDSRRLSLSGVQRGGNDALGRRTQQGAYTLGYDAAGQLQSATQNGREIRYLYDESGHRIAKLVNGTPVLAFVSAATLDSERYVQPVKAGDYTLGVMVNGELRPNLSDSRGTVLVDSDGRPGWARPFGERDASLPHGAALDYAGKGRDADLGTVRMGLRDYDPAQGEFTTPDPVLAADLGLCFQSPKECNFYTYARNAPLDFVDPDGTLAFAAPLVAGAAAVSTEAMSAWVSAAATLHVLQAVLKTPLPPDLRSTDPMRWEMYRWYEAQGIALGFIGHLEMTERAQASGSTIGFQTSTQNVSPSRWDLITPAMLARSFQGSNYYPGVDVWKNGAVLEGQIVYGGSPGQTAFYTTLSSVQRGGESAESMFRGLQVKPHEMRGLRQGMTAYRVVENARAAFAQCKANPEHGDGGLFQIYIPEYKSALSPLYTIPLNHGWSK